MVGIREVILMCNGATQIIIKEIIITSGTNLMMISVHKEIKVAIIINQQGAEHSLNNLDHNPLLKKQNISINKIRAQLKMSIIFLILVATMLNKRIIKMQPSLTLILVKEILISNNNKNKELNLQQDLISFLMPHQHHKLLLNQKHLTLIHLVTINNNNKNHNNSSKHQIMQIY